MQSIITAKDKSEFWIKMYLNTQLGYVKAAIWRAYRDFNRTLELMPQGEEWREEWRNRLAEKLENKLSELFNMDCKDQESFTIWHQQTCAKMIILDDDKYKLTIGQAQKWINMTLKYLSILGEELINGVMRNYQFYHIPVDNIIQTELEKHGISKIVGAWSKISDYDTYYNYQKEVKSTFPNQIPLDVEFLLFNNAIVSNNQ